MPELPIIALAVRMRCSVSEIYENWSQRDVNLILFFLQAQSIAREPDEREFYRRLADLR